MCQRAGVCVERERERWCSLVCKLSVSVSCVLFFKKKLLDSEELGCD